MTFPNGAAAVRHTDVAVERTLECDVGAVIHFNGGTPVDAADTFTETYNTPHRTLATATYAAPSVTSTAVATTAATNSSPFGYAEAQANALVACANANKVDIAATNTALAALAADVLQLKKNVVALVQDLKACGLQKTS